MDVFEHLKSEHEDLQKLLTKLEETTNRASKTRSEGLEQVRHDLALHMAFEEQVFYPELMKQPELQEYALEGYEEHDVAKYALRGMEGVDTSDDRWGAKIKVLKELIEHHVEEEEGEMFPEARQELDKDTVRRIGEQVEAQAKDFERRWAAGERGAIAPALH